MRPKAVAVAAVVLVLFCSTGTRAEDPTTLVVCAPGFPSNTVEAQPTMDELAGALARGAGWEAGQVRAAYYPNLEDGLAALREERAGWGLVPLPFYLEFRDQLELRPALQVTRDPEASEVWSLVAARGAIDAPEALAGWELSGISGYSPRFVRRVVLADWGDPPVSAQVRFGSRVLADLRKAAGGERVAVVLDRAQTVAMPSLPFAGELEVVTRSRPLPGTLLCRVGERTGDERAGAITNAFLALAQAEGGPELLATLRITRFQALDLDELARIERAFGGDEDRDR